MAYTGDDRISLYSPEKLKRLQDFDEDTEIAKKMPKLAVCRQNSKMISLQSDVILIVKEEKEVKTSRTLLRHIPYFDALFSFTHSSYKRDKVDSIDMTEFNEPIVTAMLHFLQHGVCEINTQSLKDILEIADYLRIETLIKYCIVTLHSYLLQEKLSLKEGHDLVYDHIQGLDRYLLYNLCDIAVEKGYLPIIKEGLATGMNPNIAYEDLRSVKTGYNLFFKAVAGGHLEITRLFLAAGANVNYQIINPRSSTLLDERDTPWIENFQAVRQRYLLRADPCSQCQPSRGCTALHVAVWCNHLEVIKLLIQSGARIQPDHDGETAIHFAAALGYLDVLKYFVDQVYQGLFNIHSNMLGTPLFRSVLSYRTDVVKYMIENGADPLQTDYAGFSIISYAAVANNIDLLKYLHEQLGLPLNEQNDTQETAIHQCASLGHFSIVEYCIARDPSLLCIQDERGDTPLHVAVLYDQMPVAQLLIDSGSQVNLANYLNEHPLHIALMENCSEIIPSLLNAGADPNAILNIRDTASPLTLAIMCGGESTLEYVKLLLKSGANPRLLHDKALILALRENVYHKDEIVKVLMQHNGNPNARCVGTPVLLDLCAMPNSSHLISLLLEKGADVNAINRQGQTALMVACAKDYKEYIEILLKHGADPLKASWHGLTAIMITQESKHPSSQSILSLLQSHTA